MEFVNFVDHAVLTPAQEAVAVSLHKTLLVSLDDLLAVVREFLNPDVSRSGLDRCLRRHGVGKLRNLSLDAGNDVQPRFLVGAERVIIVDRSETMDFQIEATPLTTVNPFQLAQDQSTIALVLVHGSDAGSIITLDMPTLQIQRPTGLTEAQGITEWPLRGVPLPASGNDQFTLTLT